MAKDTLELVDDIGWTTLRQLHVLGVSMGGMIAQELALMVPERIASLSLVSTGPKYVVSKHLGFGYGNFPSHDVNSRAQATSAQFARIVFEIFNTVDFFENLRNRINIFIPKSIDVELTQLKARLFSETWLNEPDAEGHFPTNGDRFAAQELRKRQDVNGFTRKGFLCQVVAAAYHHKSAKQLEELGDKVGRNRILVVHGTLDRMITVPHGELLCKELGEEERGVTKVIVEGKGHGLPMEWRREFTRLIGGFVEKTEKL